LVEEASTRGGEADEPLAKLVQEYVDHRGLVHKVHHQSGQRRDPERGEEYYCCAWSVANNGDPLLCFGGKLAIIKVVNYKSRRVVNAMQGHGNELFELKGHPTKLGIICSASKDQSVRLWNVQTGTVIMILAGLDGHKADVITADFHQLSGDRLASGAEDHTAKIWDLKRYEDLLDKSFSWEGHPSTFPTAYMQTPAFSTNPHDHYVDCVCWYGDLLLTKSTQGSIILWKPEYGADGTCDGALPLKTFKIDDINIFFVRFSVTVEGSRSLLALGNSLGKVFIWDIEAKSANPKEIVRLSAATRQPGVSKLVRRTAFSYGGRYLGCVTDNLVCVWKFL